MIYTSYFDNMIKITDYYHNNNRNVIFVSIAKYPKYGHVLFSEYKQLAPTDEILWDYKSNGGKTKYTKRYKEEILSKLNVSDVLSDFKRFIPSTILMQLRIHKTTFWQSDIADIVLVCHEPYEEDKNVFCHRFIVSDWFNDNGILCSELKISDIILPYTTTNP